MSPQSGCGTVLVARMRRAGAMRPRSQPKPGESREERHDNRGSLSRRSEFRQLDQAVKGQQHEQHPRCTSQAFPFGIAEGGRIGLTNKVGQVEQPGHWNSETDRNQVPSATALSFLIWLPSVILIIRRRMGPNH